MFSIVLNGLRTTSMSLMTKNKKGGEDDKAEVNFPKSSNGHTSCRSYIWRETSHTLCTQQPSDVFVGRKMRTTFKSASRVRLLWNNGVLGELYFG